MFIKKIKRIFFPSSSSEPVLFSDSRIQDRSLVSPLAMVRSSKLNGKVKVDDHARLNEVTLSGNITIGKNTSIWGPNADIFCAKNEVRIGNFCSIARNVSIQEYNHIYDRCTSYFIFQNVFGEKTLKDDISSSGDVIIGNDVWIGTQCVILSGARIGNGAVIAANSVVNSEIPPYAIVAGSPAKVIRYRFDDEIIKKLQSLEWWNWSHERIKQNRQLFEGKLTIDKLNAVV